MLFRSIGAAAVITGPGVYRHFPSKQALLEHLCDRAMTRMLDGARDTPVAHPRPDEALVGLVDLHVAFAVGERTLLGVWAREQRALSDEVRRSLRRRQRAYEQVWRDVLLGVRPELSPDEAQVVVSATLGLLNTSALVDTTVPAPRLAQLLRRAALAALRAPAGPG